MQWQGRRSILPLLSFMACFCLGKAATECSDISDQCQHWAETHECIANPFYMRVACRKACRACAVAADSAEQPTFEGYATEVGTRKYATMLPFISKHAAPGHFRKDTSMGSYLTPGQRVRSTPWLTLSSFGTGTYLGDADEETDEAVTAALIKAIYHGLNVVDTASNYRGGRGELSVGAALKAVLELPGMSREMLFLSTKAGFVDGATLQALRAAGDVAAEDVQGGVSCIAPACLEASLRRSLTALGLQTVDLLYLHNAAEMRGDSVDSPAFWDALAVAFAWLEGARSRGLLRAYGLATWTCFRVAGGAAGFLGLQRIVELAETVGGKEHGFRYIQLPINAGMLEAVSERWQPLRIGGDMRHVTLLEAAAQLGVGVFASGPLGEGSLAGDAALKEKLERTATLRELPSASTRLLHFARSVPLLLSTVVGQKAKAHVEENLRLVSIRPLTEAAFKRARDEL